MAVALLLSAGSLWVGAWPDRQVVRIDPRSSQVVARFSAGAQIRPAWRLMQRRSG